jgi:hypothetical protein
MMVAKMIARGSVRLGLCTSSPAVETASRPIKVKKIEEAATPMPAAPKGANGVKLSPEKAVNAIMTKRISTAILMITMTAFAVADSRAPRMSSRQHSVTSTIAGKLKSPPSPGAATMASGMRNPNRLENSSSRYCAHPTETAAEETPYSRSKHAATPNATISPIVA